MFDDREQSIEKKYAKDEEFRFKVQARAVKLFGLWVAGQLGKQGEAAENYADEVVESDFDEPGIQDVIRKVKKDFADAGQDLSDTHLEKQYNVHVEEAKKALAG